MIVGLLLAIAQDPAPLGSKVEVTVSGPGEVTFSGPDGKAFRVPAFREGDVWKARFSPRTVGAWTWGASGRFTAGPAAAGAPDLLRWGPLRHAPGHVLKFADGPAWLKAEAGGDWDLLGADAAGREARLAVLDELRARGVNSLSLVLTARADEARLREWEELFTQAERRGFVLHLVLTGAGDRREADPAAYHREMVARFWHHPGLLWNLAEEADRIYNDEEQRDLATKLRAADPYGHPITVHRKSLEADELQVWPHLGLRQFDFASVLVGERDAPLSAAAADRFSFAVWANREKSDAMSHPLPVTVDRSLLVDKADDAARFQLRSRVLYPVYLSGGGLGLRLSGDRAALKSLAPALDDLRRAHGLVASLPFAEMAPANSLLSEVSGNFCFAKAGEAYAVYLTKGAEVSLDLRDARGRFRVRWQDVRTGASADGEKIDGGDWRSLGKPPYEGDICCSITRP